MKLYLYGDWKVTDANDPNMIEIYNIAPSDYIFCMASIRNERPISYVMGIFSGYVETLEEAKLKVERELQRLGYVYADERIRKALALL